MTTPKKKTTTANLAANLRERVLADLAALKLPIPGEALDAALARAEQEGLSYLNFLELLVGEPAARRCQRAVERRIREARFRDERDLADFDWKFNAATIDRAQIEQLATRRVRSPRREPGHGRPKRRGQESSLAGAGEAFLRTGIPRALHHQRQVVGRVAGLAGRPELAAANPLLVAFRSGHHRRIRLRPHRTRRVPAGRQPLLQGDRRPQRQAFHRPGHEHRLRSVERLPGRPAAGDGLFGPRRGRCDPAEDPRKILSRHRAKKPPSGDKPHPA